MCTCDADTFGKTVQKVISDVSALEQTRRTEDTSDFVDAVDRGLALHTRLETLTKVKSVVHAKTRAAEQTSQKSICLPPEVVDELMKLLGTELDLVKTQYYEVAKELKSRTRSTKQ